MPAPCTPLHRPAAPQTSATAKPLLADIINDDAKRARVRVEGRVNGAPFAVERTANKRWVGPAGLQGERHGGDADVAAPTQPPSPPHPPSHPPTHDAPLLPLPPPAGAPP